MTDPVKMQAIVQAAKQWYEARQAVIDGKMTAGNVFALYEAWTEAEEKLAKLVSKDD